VGRRLPGIPYPGTPPTMVLGMYTPVYHPVHPPGYTSQHTLGGHPGYRRPAEGRLTALTRALAELIVAVAGITVTGVTVPVSLLGLGLRTMQ